MRDRCERSSEGLQGCGIGREGSGSNGQFVFKGHMILHVVVKNSCNATEIIVH